MFDPSKWLNGFIERGELEGFISKVAMLGSMLIVGFVVFSFLFCFPAGC